MKNSYSTSTVPTFCVQYECDNIFVLKIKSSFDYGGVQIFHRMGMLDAEQHQLSPGQSSLLQFR